jgi:hypothetical protein
MVLIDAIASFPEERDVYYLSLQDNHNFFVSQHEILVHNFAIPVIGGAIAWFLENFVVTFGITIFGIGAVIYNNEKSKGEFPQQDGAQEESNEEDKDKNEEIIKDPQTRPKEEEKSKERKECKWKDTTKPGSIPNNETDLTREEFEENLRSNGWKHAQQGKGKVVDEYSKNGARYIVRNDAKSTKGPTADYYAPGNDDITHKIRFLKN